MPGQREPSIPHVQRRLRRSQRVAPRLARGREGGDPDTGQFRNELTRGIGHHGPCLTGRDAADPGAQRVEPLVDALVAALNLGRVVDGALSLGT